MKKLIDSLQVLQSSFKALTFEAQKYHYMIKGKNFYNLHKAFEEVYDYSFEKEDVFAERILMLGGKPVIDILDIYKKQRLVLLPESDLKESKMIETLLLNYQKLLDLLKLTLSVAEEEKDPATESILTDTIVELEKFIWMLSAYSTK